MFTSREYLLPPRPEEPGQEDCCGSGCTPCVFDVYRKQLLAWEQTCRTILEGKGHWSESPSPVLSQMRYTPFQLVAITENACNANVYKFQAVELSEDSSGCENVVLIKKCLELSPGQHLVMRCDRDKEGGVFSRAYTPISNAETGEPGCFNVLIKLYEEGKMSHYIRNLKAGEIVYWRGPYGDFCYTRNQYRFVVMLCAGTGVAPMYPIARKIVNDDLENTIVRLLFACKECADILLRDEIRELTAFWNFTTCTFLSSGGVDGARYGENIVSGRIDSAVVNKELVGKPLPNYLVLICGPESFNKDMLAYVLYVGVPSKNVHVF